VRAALLVNAAAGRGRASSAAAAVAARLTAAGAVVEPLVATDRAAAEAAVAAVHDRFDVVVALGGDGVVHAALQGLAGTGTPLAVLPAGTGNDLALALGVPADPLPALDAALADLSAGGGRAVDLVRSSSAAGERWWATVLCCGFDSAVSDRVNRLRWPRGPRRYDLAIALELARLRPRPVRVTVDGVTTEREVTLVAVGNTPFYGGGLRICPDADPADGRLDVTVVGPVGRTELVRTRPRLAAGTHVDHPAVQVLRGREVQLASTEPLTTWADGEPVGPVPVRSTVVPAALTVLGAGRR